MYIQKIYRNPLQVLSIRINKRIDMSDIYVYLELWMKIGGWVKSKTEQYENKKSHHELARRDLAVCMSSNFFLKEKRQ